VPACPCTPTCAPNTFQHAEQSDAPTLPGPRAAAEDPGPTQPAWQGTQSQQAPFCSRSSSQVSDLKQYTNIGRMSPAQTPCSSTPRQTNPSRLGHVPKRCAAAPCPSNQLLPCLGACCCCSTCRDGYKVLIIGGGAAGITTASHYARKLPGAQVAVIEVCLYVCMPDACICPAGWGRDSIRACAQCYCVCDRGRNHALPGKQHCRRPSASFR
jgi:hypothetical protein